MKKESRFFAISILIHAIALILSLYIILPSNTPTKIFEKIDTDIFKIIPQVKENIRDVNKNVKKEPEKKAEPEKTTESKSSEPEPIKLADQESLAALKVDTVIISPRPRNNTETRTESLSAPQPKRLESWTPNRRITTSPEKKVSVSIPNLNQNIGNIGIKSSGYKGPGVGPLAIGSSAKGQSTRYIDAMQSVSPRSGVSQFANLLPTIAQGILKRVNKDKLDVVFIIDTTGSMEDNVVGVKQYIHFFFDPLKERNLDVNLGLVEFSDISVRKEKIFGLTDNLDKFRKRLDKVVFYGGGDLPESGYEAILTALDKIKFRKSAQKVFILMSDSPQHDLDYDGKSTYTLDRIISMLKEENVSVDVIGIDDLAMKQLALGTGGQWKFIPGGDSRLDIPKLGIQKIFSGLAVSSTPDLLEDKVTVLFENVVPDWIDFTYKILDPQGTKVLGTLTYRKEINNKSEKKVEIPVTLNIGGFRNIPGVYTLIYRTKDSYGNQNILRQTFELIQS
jgi:hypothetical protein